MAKKKKNSQVPEIENQNQNDGDMAVSLKNSIREAAQALFQDEALESSLDEILETDSELDTMSEATLEFDADIEAGAEVFLTEDHQVSEGFLPEVTELEADSIIAGSDSEFVAEGTELDGFESAEIEDLEFIEEERLESIIESVLFASDRPVSLASLKMLFTGTNVRTDKIRRVLEQLSVEFAGGRRGVTLEEVPGGYQLRTKIDNLEFLKRTLKTRQFKLSGPALEVLAIVAYKQPVVKSEVDEIRGVESGHLLRALMEKNLVNFEGKSDFPGRPMQYGTTKKFLEIFGLRNLKELPTLSQIDELLPEGIDEQQAEEKPTLASITDSLSEGTLSVSYSSGEDELMKIQSQLEEISTSSTFFEEEKRRQAEKRDQERAQNIREALAMGEPVSTRDSNWLKKFDEALAAGTSLIALKEAEMAAKKAAPKGGGLQEDGPQEIQEAIAAFESDEDASMASDDQLNHFENENDLSADLDADLEADADEELHFFGEAEEIDEV